MKIRRTTGRGRGISFLGINQYCEGYSVSSLNCGNSTLVERVAVVVVVLLVMVLAVVLVVVVVLVLVAVVVVVLLPTTTTYALLPNKSSLNLRYNILIQKKGNIYSE